MKAQITIYVVIGMILVILIALGYYILQSITKSEFEKEKLKAATVPEKAKTVKNFIDSCVEQTAKEAAIIASSQAGYVIIPQDITPRSLVNPFSNSLEIFPNSFVPYWYYESSSGVQKSQVPSKKQIESELSNFINENIVSCLKDLNKFEQQGYKLTFANPESKVEIASEALLITTAYPLEINLDDFNYKFSNLYNEVKIPLGYLYDSAQKIFKTENELLFLENMTLDFLSVYPEIPYSGVDFECTPKSWERAKVYNSLKKIISNNIQFIRIKGADYSSDPDKKYFEVPSNLNKDLTANINYFPEWPLYMDIVSHDGPLIGQPLTVGNDASKFLMQFFCLNQYNFVYDIKYPVLISITKDDFTFQFALMVLIDNNQPRFNKLQVDQTYDLSSEICNAPTTRIRVNTLAVKEDNSLTPVNNVKVSFECITATCNIGSTSQSSLTANFPFCVNGFIKAESQDHHFTKEPLTTDEEKDITLILEPYYKKKVEIKVIESGFTRNLTENENVIIQLENSEKQHTLAATKETSEVLLIAGNYHLTSYLIQESSKGINLKGKSFEACSEIPVKGILGFLGSKTKKCESIAIPDTEVNEVTTGGSEFDFNLDRKYLASSSTIVFYIPRDKFPTTSDELNLVVNNLPNNIKKPGFKYPALK